MTTPTQTVTASELLAVMGARELRGQHTVFAGVGAPMMASVLAQRLHAPDLTIVVEGGIVGPQWKPGWLPISTNEMRAAYRAQMLPGITDALLLAQRGFLDVGFLGGAQIDRYGNLNTSAIGGYARPKVRLPGSGGANDIISLCRSVIILTVHEPRRFVEAVDFVTIVARDTARTAEFFRKALGMKGRRAGEEGFIELRLNPKGTSLTPFTPSKEMYEDPKDFDEDMAHVGEDTSIMFETKDIYKLQDELMAKGVRFSKKAEKAEWGGIQAEFLDPDDNTYVLYQNPK